MKKQETLSKAEKLKRLGTLRDNLTEENIIIEVIQTNLNRGKAAFAGIEKEIDAYLEEIDQFSKSVQKLPS
jgi:archaellum component FlaC